MKRYVYIHKQHNWPGPWIYVETMAKTKKLIAPVRNSIQSSTPHTQHRKVKKTYTQRIIKVSAPSHKGLNIFISSQPTRNNGSKHVS